MIGLALRGAAFAIAAGLGTALCAEEAVPQDGAEIALTFAPVVRATAPAVVNIYATQIVPEAVSPFAGDPFFSQFFGSQVVPRVQNSLGSGVIVAEDGIVVSNHHVTGNAADIRVVLPDRREFSGEVILSDPEADLAVIRLEGASGLPALPFADSDAVEVGDLVLAIGNPFGVGQTVTSGIVSATARPPGGAGQPGPMGGPAAGQPGGRPGGGAGVFIQTDAAINPGNSGGALVDVKGRLVGINTSILTRSGGSQGIGFAIPSDLVAAYVAQARAGAGRFARPWAGIDVQEMDPALAEAMGLGAPQGVVIRAIHPESPFAAAGLAAGDVILSLDGYPVSGAADLGYRMAVLAAEGAAEVAFAPGGDAGDMRTASVTIAPAPGADASPVRLPRGSALEGLAVVAVTPALIDAFGLPLDAAGVAVTEVDGVARRLGLEPGDLIVAVNGARTATPEDLAAQTDMQTGREWRIAVERGGRFAEIRLRM